MAVSLKEVTMEETANSENNPVEPEKPVQVLVNDEVKFPPFPEPTDDDFEKDITGDEKNYYKNKFKELDSIKHFRLHCTACDRHLGCSLQSTNRMRIHPMLRTLMCHNCHIFYNSGEFEKGDDGSELYCRWCGQGGQVYCCSECPHVFCAKCVKRNFGTRKIKDIEETDDWKCFKCDPKYLWDLRSVCWAVFRYCNVRSKIIHETQDQTLKAAYQKEFEIDQSDCCKSRNKRKEKVEDKKPKPKEEPKKPVNIVAKPQSMIQVKKFASINLDENIVRNDCKKTPQKRPSSPKNKSLILKNPVTVGTKMLTPIVIHPIAKKMRMTSALHPVRIKYDRKTVPPLAQIRPKCTNTQVSFNGYNSGMQIMNNIIPSDNINLSLENLTQGLDMAAVAGMTNNIQNNDVVCTPDFPLEPLCEVTEDNNDDDVECIGPVVENTPPLVSHNVNPLPAISSDSIIQMTENDVTVNSSTGGLKFRVDPQTLSSNKMYRLPDGRIFAINANPSMPGGYSATIVAVTDDSVLKLPPKGTTYAAKLSSVASPLLTPPTLKVSRNLNNRRNNRTTHNSTKKTKINRGAQTSRECDLNVPVEWYRYNLTDAEDALEYSLSRVVKLKQEATTMFLRTRSVGEMRILHNRLENILNTTMSRFNEIRENIGKELKEYTRRKQNENISDDDDDVEILQDNNDDPIYIDENSVESNGNECEDVDLTVMGSSDLNDSSEKSLDKNDGVETSTHLFNKHKDAENNISIVPDSVTSILDDKDIENVEIIDQDLNTCYNDQVANNAVNNRMKNRETMVNTINGEDTTSSNVIENTVEDNVQEVITKEDIALSKNKTYVADEKIKVTDSKTDVSKNKTDVSEDKTIVTAKKTLVSGNKTNDSENKTADHNISEDEEMKLLYDENDH